MPIDPLALKRLFQQAITMADRQERTAWLVRECGDNAELLAKLQALLAARDDPDTFLERLAPLQQEHTGAFTPSEESLKSIPLPSSEEKPGHVVGRYKLLEKIGEGGMGSVWMAEQREPVKRLVAIKLIRAGMDTQAVLTRFEAERQALALMDHPNIAKVLDGGTTESRRPYFVMELVKGLPLTEYCDNRRLSVDARLQLFIQICSAVQHAHQKGIIHRDLKPSNVLVTENDGKPIPKVIDFGLAKALTTSNLLTDRTLHTAFGTVVGTPLYMAPEQVGINALDTDTRSDVYALGVMLYELLTGTTPLEKRRFKEAAWEEVKRVIQEEEPIRPSMRLSTSEALPNLAANRHTEPAKLTSIVRGELDWIVMKALEKDRNRRYETANGFAMDLQRYLANEAVTACPPSAGYRFRKFVSRNKGKVLAGSIVLAALLFGILGTTWGMMQARTERDEKEQARQAAEESFQRTRQVVDDFFTLVSQNTIFNVPGLQPVRKELLEKARDYYQETHQKRPDDPNILAGLASAKFRLAVAYFEISRADDMMKLFAEGLEDVTKLRNQFPHDKLSHAKAAGFWKGLRRTEGYTAPPKDAHHASQVLQRFAKLWTIFIEENPKELKFQSDRASTHGLLGALHATMLGGVDRKEQFDLARSWFDKSIVEWEQLIQQRPKETSFRESLVETLSSYTAMLNATGQQKDVEQLLAKINQLSNDLAADHPTVPQYREYLIANVRRNANQLNKAGKVNEAEQEYRRAIQLMEEHVAQQSGTSSYGTTQLNFIRNWIALLKKTGKVQDAEPVIKQLIVNCRKRHNFHSELPNVFRELINGLTFAAEHAREQGRNEDAEAYLVEIHSLLKSQKPVSGKEYEHQERLGHFLLWQLRPFYEAIGRQQQRQEVCKEALVIYEKLSQLNDQQSWLYWTRLGEARANLGQSRDAVTAYSHALELKADYPYLWGARGDAYSNLKQHDKAVEDYSKAIDLDPKSAWVWRNRAWNYTILNQWDKAVADYRQSLKLDNNSAYWHYELGIALEKTGKIEDSINAYRKASELDPKNEGIKKKLAELETTWKLESELIGVRKAVENEPANPVHYRKLGITLLNQSKLDEAVTAFRKAIELEPNSSNNHNNLGVALARLKKIPEAITSYRKAAELDPNSKLAHNNLANTLLDSGNQPEAITAYRKVLELDPKNAGAMNNLAWMLLTADDVKQRNPQEALTLSRKAVELTKDNWVNLDTYSAAAYRNGHWKESLESREKMIKLRKPRTEDKFFLAMCLWKLDRKDEARKYFTEAHAEFAKLPNQNNWLTEIQKEAVTLLGATNQPKVR